MKKVLYLLLLTCSIFSMQLNTIKHNCLKIKNIHHKLVKHHLPKFNDTKEHKTKISDKKSIDYREDLIDSSSIFASQSLGEIKLFHNEKGFHILHNNEIHQPALIDKIVCKATPLQIKDFQKVNKGYLHINQMADGKFEIKVMDRLPGGGPVFGAIAYWVTKSLCYGTAIAATGAVIVGTGGAAVAGSMAIAGAVGVAAPAVGAGVGAGMVAAGVIQAGLAGEAAVITAGVVSSIGGIGGTITAVESASASVGLLFSLIPFLP